MDQEFKLSIQMVPQPLWERNLRKLMSQYEWGKLRKKVLLERGLTCVTCGFVAPQSKNIYCHEKWSYETENDPWIARLTGIELTCWNCHAIEHWGRTERLVSQGAIRAETLDLLVEHFAKVNQTTVDQFEKHRQYAVEKFSTRSSYYHWEIEWGPFKDWVEENYEGDPFEGIPHLF
jgi:hypothetical protein